MELKKLLGGVLIILILLNMTTLASYAEDVGSKFIMTQEEKNLINSLGEIQVMVDDHFIPLSLYSESDEKYRGASVELFEKTADLIGLRYKFNYEKNLTWSEKIERLKKKEIDLLFPMSITASRKNYGYYTNPYYTMYYSVIMKADGKKITKLNDLFDEKVGAVRGTSIITLIENYIPQKNIAYYESDKAMYAALQAGKVDYIFQNENVFNEDFYSYELFDFINIYKIEEFPREYSYLFKKTDEMQRFIKIWDRAMSHSFNMDDIISKYEIGEKELLNKYLKQKRIQSQIVISIFILLVVIIGLTYQYKSAKKMSEIMKKEASINKMAYLQSQIKPHFLFNALGTIMSLCYTQPEQAGDLLSSMSKYLRIVFTTDNQMESISLRREIELVNAYVEIEKARYGERVSLNFDIEEVCLSYSIPPLCIQPLVENAILHGITKKEQGGTVWLSVHTDKNRMKIIVMDDGIGMQEEEIHRIINEKSTESGIGLSNIRQRVLSYATGEMIINSKVGNGTEITVFLPILNNHSKEESQCCEPSL
ncbi:MAG: sensor histidine kinase [Aminipila sp.]